MSFLGETVKFFFKNNVDCRKCDHFGIYTFGNMDYGVCTKDTDGACRDAPLCDGFFASLSCEFTPKKEKECFKKTINAALVFNG